MARFNAPAIAVAAVDSIKATTGIDVLAGLSPEDEAAIFAAMEAAIRDKCGDSCLARVKPNEPIFVLRAQDRFAAGLVRIWASMVAAVAVAYTVGDPEKDRKRREKISGALAIGEEMDGWTARQYPD